MEKKKKRKRKLSINNQKHLKRKQDPFLQFETLSYYRNGYIGLHYKNDTLTRREINNIHVKNHELDRIKL